VVGRVDYEGNVSQGLISINGLPFKIVVGDGEEKWGGGSLI